ncbi:hypothetical protein BBJ28_00009990 [Nothophytophthora sp. Chile5]|nr:hypothetical protein BBJ28_00009990 [Nothophytophthora sp. Chile5]
MSLGIARRSLDLMSNYAKERKAFGRPLNKFGQIQKDIAESYAEYMVGRAYYNVERLWRDSKLLEIGGGTNESHHKNMVQDLAKRAKF